MPALPSKGKSRDLSFAALIPVSADGVVKRLGNPDEEQHALLLFLSGSGPQAGGPAAGRRVRAAVAASLFPLEEVAPGVCVSGRWRNGQCRGATDSGQSALPMLGVRQCALSPFPACQLLSWFIF